METSWTGSESLHSTRGSNRDDHDTLLRESADTGNLRTNRVCVLAGTQDTRLWRRPARGYNADSSRFQLLLETSRTRDRMLMHGTTWSAKLGGFFASEPLTALALAAALIA